jgi:tetratricopeptide (TPR) repeat protein
MIWAFLAVLVCAMLPGLSNASDGRVEGPGLSIECGCMRSYAEADCTRIRVYIRNDGDAPALVERLDVGPRELSVDDDADAATASGGNAVLEQEVRDYSYIARRTDGDIQWVRVLPNPIAAGAVGEVAISLWGVAPETPIRIVTRDGRTIEWLAREEEAPLRFSHIAFEPTGPGKTYVYVENTGETQVEPDRFTVNAETVGGFQSVLSAGTIRPGEKGCFIIRPTDPLKWGEYVSIGMTGKGGEKTAAVVRVMNLFPIASWSGDTRRELFFDSADIRKRVPGAARAAETGVPCAEAYGIGNDPTCVGESYEANAREMMRETAARMSEDPAVPTIAHLCKPSLEAYGFFGGVPDMAFINPFTALFRAPFNPEASAGFLRAARAWCDPRPIAAMPEAFSEARRDMTPEEVSFITWGEIGESAKGVRYFADRGKEKFRGYAEMAGVEKALARENLNLQLLKGFLRVSDTHAAVATDNGKVIAKSLLCGDKGLVVVLLNADHAEAEKSAPLWTPVRNVRVRVAPDVARMTRGLFAVEQGLEEVSFESDGEALVFTVPMIGVRRVFLLTFSEVPALSGGTADVADFSPRRNATEVPIAYWAEMSRLAGPLLDPARPLAEEEVLKIGRRMHQVRAAALARMEVLEKEAESLAANRRLFAVCGLVRGYLDMGCPEQAERLSLTAVQNAPAGERQKTCRALVTLSQAGGEYHMAARICELAFELEQDRKARFEIAGHCADLFQNNILDNAQAARWSAAQADEGEDATEEVSRTRLRAAAILLENGDARAAIEQLEKVKPEHATGLPLEGLLAEAYMKEGRRDKAREHFERAVSREPEEAAKARYMVAQILLSEGKYDEARQRLDEVLKEHPGSPYAEKAKGIIERIPRKE